MKAVFVDTVDQVLEQVLINGNGSVAASDGKETPAEPVKTPTAAAAKSRVPRTALN